MRVSYNWLSEYVDGILPDIDILAKELTFCGLEVECVEKLGEDLVGRLKVAKILEVAPHPNADKLSLCEVDDGSGGPSRKIVCGATNMKAGDMVALANPGVRLPNGVKIKKSKIRGETSDGMLCSLAELEAGEDASGIIILPETSKPGESAAEVLGLVDTILEIGITPNRPDCLSMVGIAREVAAIFGDLSLMYPLVELEESDKQVDSMVKVTVVDDEGCPRYAARLVEGVQIGPSPDWMQRRLMAADVRPINNVVDITNYVMLELGQPLHAFDLKRLAGPEIVVRRASEGEKFVTLDDEEMTLREEDLLICDIEKPVAVAGVMGGQHSGVTDDTKDVLIESAYFSPQGIRRTSRRLGLRSESSHRFERGVDPEGTLLALGRAAAFMAELAGGKVLHGLIDERASRPGRHEIKLRPERVEKVLGLFVEREQIVSELRKLEIDVSDEGAHLVCTTPTFRVDLNEEIDLIEEVARLTGYDRVPVTSPLAPSEPLLANANDTMERKLKVALSSAGFSEAVTFAFDSPESADLLRLPEGDLRRSHIKILNPVTQNHSVMRTSLYPHLLRTAANNLNRLVSIVWLFEVGKIYLDLPGDEGLPVERLMACGIAIERGRKNVWGEPKPLFFKVKAGLIAALAQVGAVHADFVRDDHEPYHMPGTCAAIKVSGSTVGNIAVLHPETALNFGIEDEQAIGFELDVESLLDASTRPFSLKPVPSYPPAVRDIAIIVDVSVDAGDISKLIIEESRSLVKEARLFDIYCGEHIPDGKKSLAFSLKYLSYKKTLSDKEVEAAHSRIVAAVEKTFNASLR